MGKVRKVVQLRVARFYGGKMGVQVQWRFINSKILFIPKKQVQWTVTVFLREKAKVKDKMVSDFI